MVDGRKYFLQSLLVFTWRPSHATSKTAALFVSMYAQIHFSYDNFTHIFCLFEMILTAWRSTTTQPCPRMSSSCSLLVECLFIRSMFVQGHDWLQGPAPTLPNCTKSTNHPHSLAEDVDWTPSDKVSGFSTVRWFFLSLSFYVVCLRGKPVYRDDQIHIVKSFVLWRWGWSTNTNDLKFFYKGYLFNLILWNFSCGV